MHCIPTTHPVDIYIRDNGDRFYNTRADERPHLEKGDFIRDRDPQPDDEERWRR